jgi:hypothetical protein
MEPTTIVNILLSLMVLAFFIGTTVKLYSRMKKTKLSNLWWLIGFFICSSLIGIFKAVASNATGVSFNILEILFYIFEFASLFCIIFFTKATYYKNQRSSFIIILTISIIVAISSFTMVLFRLTSDSEIAYNNFYLVDVAFLSLLIILPTFWNASASFKMYNLIHGENLDKNIKLRYKILAITFIIYGLQGIFTTIHLVFRVYASAEFYEISSKIYTFMNVTLQLIFAAGNFYAWITLGSKIDKAEKAKPVAVAISEEEVMKLAKTEG